MQSLGAVSFVLKSLSFSLYSWLPTDLKLNLSCTVEAVCTWKCLSDLQKHARSHHPPACSQIQLICRTYLGIGPWMDTVETVDQLEWSWCKLASPQQYPGGTVKLVDHEGDAVAGLLLFGYPIRRTYSHILAHLNLHVGVDQ